jgi:hypothetical protein
MTKLSREQPTRPKKVKDMVKLFKKFQWFKDLVFKSTRHSIIPYLQLSKINGMTRWEIFAKITQKVKDEISQKIRFNCQLA